MIKGRHGFASASLVCIFLATAIGSGSGDASIENVLVSNLCASPFCFCTIVNIRIIPYACSYTNYDFFFAGWTDNTGTQRLYVEHGRLSPTGLWTVSTIRQLRINNRLYQLLSEIIDPSSVFNALFGRLLSSFGRLEFCFPLIIWSIMVGVAYFNVCFTTCIALNLNSRS